jgi:hypothetical protein
MDFANTQLMLTLAASSNREPGDLALSSKPPLQAT